MSTVIVPEVSKKNKWHIPKYRSLELKYFCLQYPEWVREYARLSESAYGRGNYISGIKHQIEYIDKTSDIAIKLSNLNSKISLVEKIAKMSDSEIGEYILKGVTSGIPFVKLKTIFDIPCERDMYYDRYRKFFWILDQLKE